MWVDAPESYPVAVLSQETKHATRKYSLPWSEPSSLTTTTILQNILRGQDILLECLGAQKPCGSVHHTMIRKLVAFVNQVLQKRFAVVHNMRSDDKPCRFDVVSVQHAANIGRRALFCRSLIELQGWAIIDRQRQQRLVSFPTAISQRRREEKHDTPSVEKPL
jgi:hypothetical protein